MQFELLKEYGKEVEENAKTILDQEFDEVIWISKKEQFAPFDFLCKKGNEELRIDVKGCLSKYIHISKNKLKSLKKGELGNFYYMLRIDQLTFHLIYYKDLFKDKNYKIITETLKFRMTHTITLSITDKQAEWLKKNKGKISPSKLFQEKIDEKIKNGK